MTSVEVFEQTYDSLGRTPTGVKVSLALWTALNNAKRIVYVPAQITFKGQSIPADEDLPTFDGKTIIHFEPTLGDSADFEFSPG